MRELMLMAGVAVAGIAAMAAAGDGESPATTAASADSAPVSAPASERQPATTAGAHELATPTSIPGVGNFAKVSEGLYRGEQPTAEGMRELKKLGIKTVVNLRDFHSDRSELKGTGLGYVHITCATWNPKEEDVVAFLKVVGDPANQPVFVHCWQGSDRTGMMVLAYRVTQQGWTVDEAIKELPNFGFHPVWKKIQSYVEDFDAKRVMKKVEEAKAVRPERVD